MLRPSSLCPVVLCLSAAVVGLAHTDAPAATAMAGAAKAWIASLSSEQRNTAVHAFSSEERENWHYVPKARQGLPLARMDAAQRELAHALLSSGLSARGLIEAESVIALERVLRSIEHADHRDENLYYFTVFGTPADTGAWGWRVEGHHLSVNITIIDGVVAPTPNFVGANPAEVRVPGPQHGQRVLAAEEDLGRALLRSLDPAQLQQAIVSPEAPGDILTRNDRQTKPLPAQGIAGAALRPDQQAKLKELVALYAHRLRDDVADDELRKIAAAGWERLQFAWSGGVNPGEPHYYRIQGPDFVIEYDNTQNHANHVHTVWRSFAGDFGRDLLQDHYRDEHQAK